MKTRSYEHIAKVIKCYTVLVVLSIVWLGFTACSDRETTNTVNAVDIEVCGHEHDCHADYDGYIVFDTFVIRDTTYIMQTTLRIDTVIVRLACEHPNCHRKHCDD